MYMQLFEVGSSLLGTTVNFGAIILGSAIGLLLKKGIPEKIKSTVMQGIGLVVIYLGISMAFQGKELLIMIFSMVLGGIIGEALSIEERLSRVGERIKARVGSEESQFNDGFVFASLVYCVGALAVIGPLESGLNNNHEILYAKSLLDGTSSIAFTSSLGAGVAFSAIPVFLYQGFIALLAESISGFLSDEVIAEMTASGGLLIMAIGLNLLKITSIKIANLLPAILIAAIIAYYAI